MQHLAHYHRQQFNIPFIAITGSNGKTTTKELMYVALSKKYKTYCTQGNFNNHIGIPLTLLSIATDVEMAIIEMGANHQKEIEGYCKIVEPTHGLITNMGKAHLEGFGGVEGVRKGKGELYQFLKNNKGVAFVREADEILKTECKVDDVVYYGREAQLLEDSPFVKYKTETGIIETHLNGVYNFYNMLGAMSVAHHFQVPQAQIHEAIAAYVSTNNRSQWVQKNTNTVLLDAYNANPSSMKVSLENFVKLQASQKVVILGDMLELGDESQAEHESLGQWLSQQNFTQVILCGPHMKHACVNTSFQYFPSPDDLMNAFDWSKYTQTHFLMKGSRGMKLERLLQL